MVGSQCSYVKLHKPRDMQGYFRVIVEKLQLIPDEQNAEIARLQKLRRAKHGGSFIGLNADANLVITGFQHSVPNGITSSSRPNVWRVVVKQPFFLQGVIHRAQYVFRCCQLQAEDVQNVSDTFQVFPSR